MATVKQSLGVQNFGAACDEGRAMQVEHAIALAHEQQTEGRAATDTVS
jgi:hypothetical protein